MWDEEGTDRVLGTVKNASVEGRAADGLAEPGRVCVVDKVGNDKSDLAADFGRRCWSADVAPVGAGMISVCGFADGVLFFFF